MKYYGSHNCPDCVNFKGYLDSNGAAYEFIDINKNMPNLKEFLRLRDNCAVFDVCKANGSVGIPAIIDGDEITIDWEGWLEKKGITVSKENKTVCSIDGTGC